MLKKSRERFSSFFLLCYPKLEKKISSFFLEFFWGDHIFFVKLISSFFSRFSFLEFHFVLYFYKISRFSVYRISRAFLSTKKSGILNSLDATFFLFEPGPHIMVIHQIVSCAVFWKLSISEQLLIKTDSWSYCGE